LPERMSLLYAERGGRELFFAARKCGLVRKVYETFAIEVLRASPAKITGVQTPDLVGCPQNDDFATGATGRPCGRGLAVDSGEGRK
jgi:hypothetical protein